MQFMTFLWVDFMIEIPQIPQIPQFEITIRFLFIHLLFCLLYSFWSRWYT